VKNARVEVLNAEGKILGTLLVPNDGARSVELEVAPELLVQIVGKDEQFVKAEYLTFHVGLAQLPGSDVAFHALNAGGIPVETLRRIKGFEETPCEKK
jgi:hypothetical protein